MTAAGALDRHPQPPMEEEKPTMNRMSLLTVGVVLAGLIAAGGAPAASDPQGFRGLSWAKPADACIQAGLCENKILPVDDAIAGKEKFLAGRMTEFHGLPVRDASFGFHENRFYTASVFFHPAQAPFERIREALTREHGAPKSEDARGALWQLGNTKVLLYKGEHFHGLIYAHGPEMAKVAKAKGYPQPPAPPASPKKKKK